MMVVFLAKAKKIILRQKSSSHVQGFFKGDLGGRMTPRFLGVTPRFWSAATAVVWAKIISGSFFGGYTAVKLSYTKVSTLKKPWSCVIICHSICSNIIEGFLRKLDIVSNVQIIRN